MKTIVVCQRISTVCPPALILLNFGDLDFAPALQKLRKRGYTIAVVLPSHGGFYKADICPECRGLRCYPSLLLVTTVHRFLLLFSVTVFRAKWLSGSNTIGALQRFLGCTTEWERYNDF